MCWTAERHQMYHGIYYKTGLSVGNTATRSRECLAPRLSRRLSCSQDEPVPPSSTVKAAQMVLFSLSSYKLIPRMKRMFFKNKSHFTHSTDPSPGYTPSPSSSAILQTPTRCKSTPAHPISSVPAFNIFLRVPTFISSFPQWVASSSCSSSPCSSVGSGNLYDPSSATQTDANFNITYLQGSVTGPIVWDQVGVGSYTIDNQALGMSPLCKKKRVVSHMSCSCCHRRQ